MSAKVLEKDTFGRVAMGRIRPPGRAVLAEKDDDAVVRDLRDGEPDRVGERLLVFDRRVEGCARIGQESPASRRANGPGGGSSPRHGRHTWHSACQSNA